LNKPGDFDHMFRQALVNLVASNIPLDHHIRSHIAGELRRLYFPEAERAKHDRQAKRRDEAVMIEIIKRTLESSGLMVKEIEAEIARAVGISVAALRKRMQRR
jgi:hypothetical protein